MFNYKCPNGLPPDECRHAPQLILNVASYFQKKQQMRKEGAEIQARESHEQSNKSAESAPDIQKQRRRG